LLTSSAQPKIQVIEATYDQHVQALRSGDIDLMFSVLRAPLAFEDLVHERLFEDPYVLACGPNHPLARSKTVNPRQLSQYDFVLPPQGFPRRMVIDQALARWHIKANRFVETSCFETVVALLTGSNCVSMLSKWHVEAAGSSLRRLHVKDSKLRRRFMGLTMRQHWLPTGLQREFLKIIRQKTQPMQASLQ
jgi:DNA-binding transcriptional LysR family regulator